MSNTNNVSIKQGKFLLVFFLLATLLIASLRSVPALQASSGLEWKGIVQTIPSGGMVGNWVIGGRTFVVDAGTRIEPEHGTLAVGVCVEVKYATSGSVDRAIKLESDEANECGTTSTPVTPTPDQSSGELYGIITSFPASLLGTWQIGGRTFLADANTYFEQKHGSFVNGVTVEVKFYSNTSGVNHATKIESKYANDSDGNDDDGNGSHDGHEGHAYGGINSLPAGMIGNWKIGEIEYVTNNLTKFKPNQAAFVLGTQVKVEYYLNASNQRIVQEMETTTDRGNVTDITHFKLVGFVQAMPITGTIGVWRVGNIDFNADSSTIVQEEQGLLAIGTYVEVEYSINNGVYTLHEIDSRIPPGAAANTTMGKIESIDGLQATGISANRIWQIDGKAYQLTTATALNKVNGALALDHTVFVNYYTTADGSAIATQIRGITLTNRVYLPAVRR